MGWNFLLIICIVCAVLCAVGFYKYVYFMSVGYGLAVAGGGVAILVLALMNRADWGSFLIWVSVIQMILFLVYGFRLAGFLIIRELKNKSYQKTLKEAAGTDRLPFFVAVFMWICMAVLYTAQVSPMFFRAFNGSNDTVVPVIGMILSLVGIVLESAADKQKSEQKKAKPDMVATQGLYKIVRCPNYFGEILFWTGVFVGGLSTYRGIGQWLMTIISYVCIVFVMFNGAQRLEKRQMARYGGNPEYNTYADSTPIIIPCIPVYHLNNKT